VAQTRKEIAAQAADARYEEHRHACAQVSQRLQTYQEGRIGLKPLLAFLLLLITGPMQLPESVVFVRVVGVTDGDTIHALAKDDHLLRVRLCNIDAPEKGQAFGQASKQNLSQYIFGRDVELRVFGRDRYGRLLAVILLDGVDINLQQVKDGMAWVYVKYIGEADSDTQDLYLSVEAEARDQRRGLWADPDPIPPWEFRAH
jgi:micrococcal nuclease